MSVRQVAAQLGVCTATVYRLFDRGELPHVRILDSIRVAPDDLRRFIEDQRRLAAHRAEFEELGVRSLDLFGSIARGDSGADSDVDLLVEFDRPVGLFQFFRVQRRLEAIVGRPVDLVMKDAIKRQLRTRILAEAVSAT